VEEAIEEALLKEIDTQAAMLQHLVDKLDARARTQNDVVARWVAIGRTDLQTGLMALRRAVQKPNVF
jgi:hypothetical protein